MAENLSLQRFYESVGERQEIDNAEGKQIVINELTTPSSRLRSEMRISGIVYAPIEVVDFIIHSGCSPQEWFEVFPTRMSIS